MNPITMTLFSVHLIAVSYKSGLKKKYSLSTEEDDGGGGVLEPGSQNDSKCLL